MSSLLLQEGTRRLAEVVTSVPDAPQRCFGLSSRKMYKLKPSDLCLAWALGCVQGDALMAPRPMQWRVTTFRICNITAWLRFFR